MSHCRHHPYSPRRGHGHRHLRDNEDERRRREEEEEDYNTLRPHKTHQVAEELSGLFIQTVEFKATSGRLVALAVDKITKVVLMHQTRKGNLYAIHTMDGGSRTVVLSDYDWAEFNDYLFDPQNLRKHYGDKAVERDCHIVDDGGEDARDSE